MAAPKPSRAKYPLATISAYGPDNRRATKLVVAILRRAGQKDPNQMRTWSTDAGDVRNDPFIAAEVAEWLHSQGIKNTLGYDRIIGCPHEEGIDYPLGRTCPQCPFWAGIDRFTHEPIPVPVAKMLPKEVLIELAKETRIRWTRSSPPTHIVGSWSDRFCKFSNAASQIPTPPPKRRHSSSAMRCS